MRKKLLCYKSKSRIKCTDWFSKTVSIAVLVTVVIISSESSVRASVFDDVWNVVTDPLKLKSGSDSLYRTILQVEQLEKQAKIDITGTLNQIRAIFLESEGKTLSDMNDLESQINEDANNLLLRGRCVVSDLLTVQFPDALSEALATLASSDPAIKILGFPILDFTAKKVPITDPSLIYYESKSAILMGLQKNVTINSQATTIFDAYQEIERLAVLARCSYPTQPLKESEFTREANSMELMSIPWTTVVTLVRQ